MTTNGSPVIRVDRVSRWFGSVVAVSDVTFDIAPGITGLLGPNGAGKTTLLRMMTGLASEIGGTAGQWISMFNLSNIPVHVNDVIFGEVSDITRSAPASELPATTLVGWYFLWILVPGGILWARYRRLTP